jgi:hypothetical protein
MRALTYVSVAGTCGDVFRPSSVFGPLLPPQHALQVKGAGELPSLLEISPLHFSWHRLVPSPPGTGDKEGSRSSRPLHPRRNQGQCRLDRSTHHNKRGGEYRLPVSIR